VSGASSSALLLLVGLAVGCSSGDSDSAVRERRARQAAIDALDAAQDARDARLDALAVCDARSLATLIRIAAGTWPWEDAITHPSPIAEDHARHWEEKTRERATREAPPEVFRCTEAAPGGASFRADLVVELSRDENVEALSRLLADDRSAALEILIAAPVPPLRMALEPLVPGDPKARLAVLAIDDLPVSHEVDEVWRAWLAARAKLADWSSVEDLLAAAGGDGPPGAPAMPSGEPSLPIRRAALQQARTATNGWSHASDGVRVRARALITDPDPVIRRDALRIAGYLRDPEAEAMVRDRAAREPDPKARVAAIEAASRFEP
jgi:hypothetical protein